MAEVRRVLTLLVALAFCGCDQLDQRLPFETQRAPTKSRGDETEDNPRPKRPVGTELPQPKMEYWIIWPSGEVTTFEEYCERNNVRRYTPRGFSTSDLLPGFIHYGGPSKPDPTSPDYPF